MIISIIGYGAIGKHYLNILKNYKIKKLVKSWYLILKILLIQKINL